MNRVLTTIPWHVLAIYLAAATIFIHPGCLQAQIVIVVPTSSDIDSLSSDELKLIFQGESSTGGSHGLSQVVEFGPAGDDFYQLLLKTDAYGMGKRWLRLVFSGAKVLPPKRFTNARKFLRYLKKHDNAIGFLPIDALLNAGSDSVRAVVIDGLDHTQTRYLFKQSSRGASPK